MNKKIWIAFGVLIIIISAGVGIYYYSSLNDLEQNPEIKTAIYKNYSLEQLKENIQECLPKSDAKSHEDCQEFMKMAWGYVTESINNCQVQKAFQAHSLMVRADLKNGTEIRAIEPKIDDIVTLAKASESKCGKIQIATE